MAFQGKKRGVLAFSATGLEQAIEELKSFGVHKNEEIKKLITKVDAIVAVLKDAEKKQISSEVHRFWLGKLKEVAFDAEDLIDELATDAAVQSMGAHTCNIPTMTTPSMMGQIHEMNDRLDALEPQIAMLVFQLSTMEDSCPGLPTWRQTGSLLPDEISVVGRDREKEHIIEILLSSADQVAESSSNNKCFSIVPIVGLGGVGKTTLSQLVYNDERVKNHFELMMWVCVSTNSDPLRLTKDIIEAALAFRGKNEKCQVNNWDSVQRILLQEIEGKTFLLVLDDVWEAEQSVWKKLLIPLHFGKKGSKVLVTSRNRAFVNKLEGPMEAPIPLGGLSDDDIWAVFRKFAFRGIVEADGTISAEYSHLEELEDGIVQRLKGSPLAARTTGSLLNHELSVQHWKTVLESELWTWEQGEGDILPALLLSYRYLPPDLKQCFAYCSLFPKDYRLSREEVVRLWEAQSFVKKPRGKRMEMMGSKYFDELLCTSFFTDIPHVDYYVMHDQIHDLAECVSNDDCFRLEGQKIVKIHDTVRHVSVYGTESGQIVDVMNKLCFNEKLRTLLFRTRYLHLNTHDLDQLFLKLKMLRVLGLSYCGISELPVSIGDLKHLRCIDLQWNDDLTQLPESLGNLYNLQVLDLKDCHSLRVLPSTMSQLVNLRHLRTDEYELITTIDGLGRLTGLQELQGRGRHVRELGGMCMLRELMVTKLEEVGSKEEAIQARLHTMEHLQVLKLYWSWNSSDSLTPELEEEVLQALRPNDGIRELHIGGYGGIKSPDWMEVSNLTSFSSLRRVSLYRCPNWQVPPCSFLGQLRHLEYLQISDMPEWEEWSCPVSWERLLELQIGGWPKLKELPLLPPTLRSLNLYDCNNLRSLPNLSGLASLETLQLESCPSIHMSEVMSPHTSLKRLTLKVCKNLHSLPNLSSLASLETLHIESCPSIHMSEVMSPHTSLKRLTLKVFKNLHSLPNLSSLASLETLHIESCPSIHMPEVMSLPSSLKRLTLAHLENLRSLPHTWNSCLSSLETLKIWDCPSLQSLPDTLSHLSSLRTLEIWRCPSIQSWPTSGLPPSLQTLEICKCPALTGSHKDKPKSMWPEVARIPKVIVDWRTLQ